jgi:hypothetical protein
MRATFEQNNEVVRNNARFREKGLTGRQADSNLKRESSLEGSSAKEDIRRDAGSISAVAGCAA